MCCNLIFTYTDKYPEELPVVEIEDSVNVEEEHQSQLLEHLIEQVKIIGKYYKTKSLFWN